MLLSLSYFLLSNKNRTLLVYVARRLIRSSLCSIEHTRKHRAPSTMFTCTSCLTNTRTQLIHNPSYLYYVNNIAIVFPFYIYIHIYIKCLFAETYASLMISTFNYSRNNRRINLYSENLSSFGLFDKYIEDIII